jgi:hypothetical protein
VEPFYAPKHTVALRSRAGISPDTGIRRNDDLSLALRVTFHSDCLSDSVRVSQPSVDEQLMGHSHVNEVSLNEQPVTDPPVCPQFKRNPVGALTITNTGGFVVLKLSVSASPAAQMLLWGTAPCSPGASFPSRFVFLGLLPEPVAGVSDITELYVAKWGPPSENRRVFIRTCQQVNG